MGQLEVRPRTEPVTGWRYWQLSAHAPAPLRSLSQRGFSWPPGRDLVARCADGSARARVHVDGQSHQAPELHCGCGIHASVNLTSLQDQALCLRPVPLVVGEVALWGRVVTEVRADRRGRDHRGQFAYPLRLWVVGGTLDGVAEAEAVERLGAYGVEVTVMALEDAVGEASQTILRHLAMSGGTSSTGTPSTGTPSAGTPVAGTSSPSTSST